MSDLSAKEKRKLEVYFEMGGGYYSAFSNNTLEAFIADTLGLELYSEKYNQGSGSKANRIRAIWELESNHIVGKLITETIEHDDDEHLTNPHMNKRDAELKSHCLKIAQRLVSGSSQKQPGFQPQQQPSGFQPKQQSSGFQPQQPSPGFQPQPQSTGFQPQPQSTGFQPQPQSTGFQPQPQSTGFQPQQSSVLQPQPQSSGFQPQPQSSGFQPQQQSSRFQPQQQLSGFQPQQQISNQALRKQTTKDTIIKNKVFIVHGHDDLAKEQIARFITQIGLVPIILHEQASSSKTIIEKIEKYAEQVCFAVVLYTPCDQGSKNGDSTQSPRARQNVVFEHGYFIGKLGRENVTAVVKGNLEKPNDISGVVYEIFDDNGAWKLKLAKEMKISGCKIDMNNII